MSQTGPLNEPGSMIGSGAGAGQMSAVFGPQTGSNESDARSLAHSLTRWLGGNRETLVGLPGTEIFQHVAWG